jgi:N-acetylmuramoyl-L-alanine amidase
MKMIKKIKNMLLNLAILKGEVSPSLQTCGFSLPPLRGSTPQRPAVSKNKKAHAIFAAAIVFFTIGQALFAEEAEKIEEIIEIYIAPQKALTLSQTIDELDSKLYWDSFFQSGTFICNGHSAVFSTGVEGESTFVLYDENEVLTLPAPFNVDGNLYFPQEFVAAIKNNIDKSIIDDASRFRIAAIVVDPGHGGKDPGAISVINGKRVVEKEIALAVSKKLYSKLKTGLPQKKILITRSGDTFPTLEQRVAKANAVPLKDNEAVIYISIHANSSLNKTARGFEVWYLDPGHSREVIDKSKNDDPKEILLIKNEMLQEEFNRESVMMATSIAKRISQSLGKDLPFRGLKAEEWFVVRKAKMPSVLVELGFVSNKEDASIMLDEGGLNKYADSIYKGLMDFVTSFEQSGGFIAAQ